MAALALKQGTVLGERYRVEQLLRESASSRTYACTDLQEGGPHMVVRALRAHVDSEAEAYALQREYSLLRRLDHPNLAKLLDLGLLPDGRGIFVVSEFVPGQSLFQATLNWSTARTLRLLAEVAALLNFLHVQGIVCGDLRASSFMTDADRPGSASFKLLYYGIATAHAPVKPENLGELLAYTAPEVLAGGEPGTGSDLYGFGVLAYYLLARRLPFQEEDPGLLVQEHLQADADMRPIDRMWGGRLAGVLRWLLEKDPSRRPASAAEVASVFAREGGIVKSEPDWVMQPPLIARRMIGRDTELAWLQEHGLRVRETGRGWSVFVTGESGSGESRCLEELAIWARLRDWRVVEARCQPGENRFYEPFRQVLIRTEALGHSKTPAESLFPSRPDRVDQPADAGRFRDLLSREIACRLSDRPTLLLLHDFHLADEATAAVLDYLASDIQSHRIYACISLLPPETAHSPAARLMDQCLRQVRADRLTLAPFPVELVQDLVESATGSGNLSRRLGPWIHHASGGSPFLAEEILSHLAEQRVLIWEGGEWLLREEALLDASPPSGVLDVIRMRLENVPYRARRIAEWLALLNRPVRIGVLRELLDPADEDLEASLSELLRRHIAERQPREGTDFIGLAHPAMTELIRAEIPKQDQARMHRRIVDELEGQLALESPVQELAMHFIEAGWTEKAVPYALLAAAACKKEMAHEAALRFHEYLLKERASLTPWQLVDVSIDAAHAYVALRKARNAIDTLTATLRDVPPEDRLAIARIFLHMARAHQAAGDLKQLRESADRGLAELATCNDAESAPIKISLYIQLAYAENMQGHPRTALNYLLEALRLTRDPEHSQQAGRIYNLIGISNWMGADLQAAARAGRKAISILERSGETGILASAISNLGEYWTSLGRLDHAIEILGKALRLSEEARAYIYQCAALSNTAEALCRAGRLREADATCRRALSLIGPDGNPALSHASRTIAAEIKILACDYSEAWRILSDLPEKGSADLFPHTMGHSLYMSALIHFQFGHFDAVLKELDRLKRLETDAAPLYHRPLGEVLHALILYERRHGAQALELMRDLVSQMDAKRWPWHQSITRLGLGELLIRSGHEEEALKFIRQAARLARGIRSTYLRSQTHMLAGMALTRRVEREKKSSPSGIRDSAGAQAAITELCNGLQLSQHAGLLEISWRTHRELARLFELLDDADSAAEHASNALEVLVLLEDRVPVQMLTGYQHALGRGHARNSMRRLLEHVKHERPEVAGPISSLENEQVRLLLRTSTSIIAIRELETLLETIVRLLGKDLSLDRILVFLKDPKRERMVLARGRSGAEAVSAGMVSPVAWRTVEESARTAQPFISADARKDVRISSEPDVREGRVGTVMCSPLKASGRIIGVLYGDRTKSSEVLDESRVNLFAAFSNLAALSIDNALAHQRLLEEKRELEEHLQQITGSYSEILGASPPMQNVRERIALAAASPLDVLIFGESGTGKELVARAIHRTGRRAAGRFITVDSGSLADSLAESEFFGYRKGSFTGAMDDRAGLLESASGGVIFFDEIANMPMRLQGTLLRALQEREIRRIGETTPRRIDVQVIAATNKELQTEIEHGRFRQDLYYRLNAMEIRMPPLRSRLEDVPLLLAYFLEKTSQEENGRHKGFSSEASSLLARYDYPGNVRELRNIVRSAYYLAPGNVIDVMRLPEQVRSRRIGLAAQPERASLPASLLDRIRSGEGNFADLLKRPFQQRQIDAEVMRQVIELALREVKGSYREAFKLLRVPDAEYSQTRLFLKRHNCYVDFHPYRKSGWE